MHVRIAHQAHCQRKLPTQHCHNTLWPSLYLGVIQHKPYTTNWPQAFITSGFALFYFFFLNIYIYIFVHTLLGKKLQDFIVRRDQHPLPKAGQKFSSLDLKVRISPGLGRGHTRNISNTQDGSGLLLCQAHLSAPQ